MAATMKRCADCGRLAVSAFTLTPRGRVCRDRIACQSREAELEGQMTLAGTPALAPVTTQLRIGQEA